MTIEEKYNIVYFNKKRYYKEDLTERKLDYENSIPYLFSYKDIEIYENSWKNMIYEVAFKLNQKNPKTNEELLSLKNDWGKQNVFSTEKLKHYKEFFDVYMNLNHTAIHAMWTLQLLLSFYNVDLSECSFYIKRNGSSEPKEVKDYISRKNKNDFLSFLINEEKIPNDKAQKVLNNLEKVNKYMPSISNAHNDLFLFDDGNLLYGYNIKLIEYLKKEMIIENNNIKALEMCLNKLYKFTYNTYNSTRKLK